MTKGRRLRYNKPTAGKKPGRVLKRPCSLALYRIFMRTRKVCPFPKEKSIPFLCLKGERLLCGLICGWGLGAVCGVAGPILSSVITGMPGAAMLMHMVPELCVYGLCAGLLMKWVRTGTLYADLYLALVPAMLLGRVVGGAVQALEYLGGTESYSLAMWVSGYFVGTLPGVLLQLVVLPALVLAVMKAGLIPARYPMKKEMV